MLHDQWWDPLLILGYAENQGRKLDETEVRAALRWSDPERDVALARICALKLLNRRRAELRLVRSTAAGQHVGCRPLFSMVSLAM